MSNYYSLVKHYHCEAPRFEDENGVILLDCMASHPPLARLQAAISKRLEAKSDAIVRGRLPGIADPPLHMVKGQELALFRLGALEKSYY
jgi:hypothetical protein